MEKKVILEKLEEFGFSVEEIPEFGYVFNYEGINILYAPDDEDDADEVAPEFAPRDDVACRQQQQYDSYDMPFQANIPFPYLIPDVLIVSLTLLCEIR